MATCSPPRPTVSPWSRWATRTSPSSRARRSSRCSGRDAAGRARSARRAARPRGGQPLRRAGAPAGRRADAGRRGALRRRPAEHAGPAAGSRRRCPMAGREPAVDTPRPNCSVKHGAMLATCVAPGWDIAGYRDPSHPLQRPFAATVVELIGVPVAHVAVDGCGAPLFSSTPAGLARALGRIAAAPADTAEGTIAAAMRIHPWWVAGTGRTATRLCAAVPGLMAKDGAEGFRRRASGRTYGGAHGPRRLGAAGGGRRRRGTAGARRRHRRVRLPAAG
jgi:hypothetical protein